MKKSRLIRDTFFLLTPIFRFVVPIGYIMFEFGAFKKKWVEVIIEGAIVTVPKYNFSWWEVVIIVLIIWAVMYFFSNLTILMRDMKEGFLRELLRGVTIIFIPLMIWASANMPAKFLSEFKQFTWILLVSSLLGLISQAFYQYYRRRTLIERGYVNVIKS